MANQAQTTDKVEAPQEKPTTPDAAPSPAQQESFTLLNDFSKTAQQPSTADVTPVTIVGLDASGAPKTTQAALANALRPEAPDAKGALEGSEFKTPVFTYDDLYRAQQDAEGQVVSEAEKPGSPRPADGPQIQTDSGQQSMSSESSEPVIGLERLDPTTKTELNTNGKLKSINTEFGDASVKFDFVGKDGLVTRTTEGAEGKQVAKFDRNGRQISNEVTDASGETTKNPVDPTDVVKVNKSPDGKVTSIESGSKDGKIKLTLDEKSNVRTAKITGPNQEVNLKFDEDGSATSFVASQFDDKGNERERMELEPGSERHIKMDENSRIVESEEKNENETNKYKRLNDGSEITSKERDGEREMEIKDKDGNTTFTFKDDGNTKTTNLTSPDGSKTRTVEYSNQIDSMTVRPDGSWESTSTDKSNGYTTRRVGKSPDDEGVEERDA